MDTFTQRPFATLVNHARMSKSFRGRTREVPEAEEGGGARGTVCKSILCGMTEWPTRRCMFWLVELAASSLPNLTPTTLSGGFAGPSSTQANSQTGSQPDAAAAADVDADVVA